MLANDPPVNASSRLVLLSLLDATLPVLHTVVAPHPIENLCVEPRSGRVFAARSLATTPASSAASAAVGGPAVGAPGSAGVRAGVAAAWGAPPTISASTGRSGSGDADVSAAAAAASSGEGWTAAAEGAVSVLALASGSFLDRGPLRSVVFRGVRRGSRFGFAVQGFGLRV